MAFPVGAAGLGATAAGGILGAVGSMFQGSAQSAMYNYQAGVALANKQLATQDANYALQTGEVEAQQQGLRTRSEVGLTKAAFGAGNIAVNSGTAGKVATSEIEIGQQNEAITRANAAKKAYGFNVAGAEDQAQAGAYQFAAKTSVEAGDIGAISSVIGGVGSVSTKWMQGQQQGIWG